MCLVNTSSFVEISTTQCTNTTIEVTMFFHFLIKMKKHIQKIIYLNFNFLI